MVGGGRVGDGEWSVMQPVWSVHTMGDGVGVRTPQQEEGVLSPGQGAVFGKDLAAGTISRCGTIHRCWKTHSSRYILVVKMSRRGGKISLSVKDFVSRRKDLDDICQKTCRARAG